MQRDRKKKPYAMARAVDFEIAEGGAHDIKPLRLTLASEFCKNHKRVIIIRHAFNFQALAVPAAAFVTSRVRLAVTATASRVVASTHPAVIIVNFALGLAITPLLNFDD